MLTLGRIVAALISGLLLAQAYSLNPIWPLAWIAPVPLLIAVIGASRLGAFLYGALAGALSMALFFAYLMDLSGPIVPIVITFVKALIWGGMCMAVRGGARHLPAWAAVFVFPVLMASIDVLIAASSPHGAAGSLAYSQMDFLPAIQVASLGGAPAITFVLALFASLLAFLVVKRALVAVIAPVIILIAVLGWGWLRQLTPLGTTPNPPNTVSIALLAGDDLDFEAPDWRPTWESYTQAAERASIELNQGAGARIVVLPEKIVAIPEGQADEALAPFSAIARQHNAVIVVGATVQEGGERYNRAYFIAPEGVRAYDKQHMIPGLESHLTPGAAALITDVGQWRMGVLICKDMDFPALVRRYGEQGVDLLLVPAWDFGADAWLHSRMAVLRGVENGFTIARSAREGVMTITDSRGRVIAEAASGADIAALEGAVVWSRGSPTLYTRIGDAFGWLCVALAVLLIGGTLLARRRAGQGS
jgi:apolipoprotein N-acyltransferase